MSPPPAPAATVREPALALADLHFSFAAGDRRVPVLRGVELVVPAGEVVAVLGPSGTGKTTLLRLLSGSLQPDRGRIEVLGESLADLGSRARRRLRQRVGHLYQNDALVPGLRTVHNVLIGRLGHWSTARALLSLLWPQDIGRARAALARVGLEDRLAAPVDTLSGGQRQRVALARLLAQDPELILADEPFTGLDPRLRDEALAMLLQLAREGGRTLLLALHDVELLDRGFDRVLALRDGRIAYDGVPVGFDRRIRDALYAAGDGAAGP